MPQLSVDEVNRELMGIPRLPAGLDPQVLARFVRHRRVLGKPMTISSWLELQPRFRQLTADDHDLNRSLRQTMAAGLALPVTPKPEGTDHANNSGSAAERVRRRAEEDELRDAAAEADAAAGAAGALDGPGYADAVGAHGVDPRRFCATDGWLKQLGGGKWARGTLPAFEDQHPEAYAQVLRDSTTKARVMSWSCCRAYW
ncbi:hypothetical protein N7676_05620 [Stenotrophomonas sp. GD03993]|uniref:hypothetical protein n=1 Tax=Stenotrophomonas TaxID=40323 RepID=UPI001313AE15|nr:MULTISPECIES: hypothetical protein [Stenotrophomonas]MDH0187566.1 hypothetical protein [Stenotrophomonas sp. GD04051]MDH0463278.1 hypothetical protein [Stenotrophomonas sp. GD03993]MDH0876147.1 hypothetical protein [Stenotrophomonas sp. GD03877]MDH2156313.1 hypothetical protein [Stenotrophomonas sp. GD03657]